MLFRSTPVSLACARGHLDMVELLLEKGANVNYNNEVRWSLCMDGETIFLLG